MSVMGQVEREVQNAYAYELSRRCEGEKAEKARAMNSARRSLSRDERDRRLKEAQAMPLHACNEFNTMFYG